MTSDSISTTNDQNTQNIPNKEIRRLQNVNYIKYDYAIYKQFKIQKLIFKISLAIINCKFIIFGN